MFLGALREVAGEASDTKTQQKVRVRIEELLQDRAFSLLEIVVMKMGRSHFVVTYVKPDSPVSGEAADELRQQPKRRAAARIPFHDSITISTAVGILPINFYISGIIVDGSILLPYGITMKLDYDTAAALLNQLGNPTRLKVVRELVRAGKTGMPVGEIQKKLGTPNSTLSHHINHLRGVGLIRQTRESTVLRCFIEYKRIEDIVKFLTEECCAAEVRK